MSRFFMLGLTMLCASTGAIAADFGHSRKDRMQINASFNAMADMCVRDFGFTRVPKKPDAVLVDKMEAYLLLANSADFIIGEWGRIASNAHAMTDAQKDDALAERLADALIAAQKDPDSYARAEALYVETLKAPAITVAGACQAATNDPFIGANYLTGDGSADRYDDKLRKMFADSVKDAK